MAIKYTTVNKVREKLGMSSDEPIQTAKTGTTLTLTHDAYSIVFCKKNGAEVTQKTSGSPGATEFVFTRPRTITLGTASQSTDVWDIRFGTHQADDVITDAIYDAEDEINARLGNAYSTPFSGDAAASTQSPDIENLAIMYIKWIFADKKWTQQYPGEMSPEDRAWKRFNEVLGQIVEGERIIKDYAAAAIARRASTDAWTVVASATPADNMTLVDANGYLIHLDRTLIVTADNTGHSLTGYGEIVGTNDEDEDLTERIYYQADYGAKKATKRFKKITQFNAVTLNDGTTPTVKLESVRYQGRVFAGARG